MLVFDLEMTLESLNSCHLVETFLFIINALLLHYVIML